MIIGVMLVGAVTAVTAWKLPGAKEDPVVAAARGLIAAQKKVPACASVLEAVLTATAGNMK